MTGANDRDVLEEQMTSFVLGEMDEAEQTAFERRLAADPEFAREVDSLRTTLALMPFAVAETPPAQLRAGILGRVPAPVSPLRRPSTWGWLLATAASIAAAILFIQNVRLDRELGLQRDVARLLQEPNVTMSFALRGTAGTRAIGRLLLDLDAKKGAAIIHDLAPVEGHQVYRLWAIVADKPVWCGDFQPEDDRTVRRQFPIPVDAYTAPISRLILTLEPGPDRPAPVGPLVMIGS